MVLMGNLRILRDEIVKTSNITSQPPVNGDLENLKHISKIIRVGAFIAPVEGWSGNRNCGASSTSAPPSGASLGEVSQTIFIEFFGAATVSALVIAGHTFSEGDMLNITFFSDNAFSIPVYTAEDITISKEDAGYKTLPWEAYLEGGHIVEDEFIPIANFVHWIDDSGTPEVQNVESVKIEFIIKEDVEINKILIGKHISPEVGVGFNHTVEWFEKSKQFRTEGSTLRSDVVLPKRRLSFSINTIQEEDRGIIQESLRQVGKRDEFYISLFSDDPDLSVKNDYSGVMKMVKEPIMTEFGNNFYKSKYVLEEV